MPLSNSPNFEPTIWEQKLRDYRLKNETAEVRAWREEAEDPNTTGERLARIAEAVTQYEKQTRRWDCDKTVNAALAQHPNTYPHLLLQLCKECAQDFCRNPIAPFLLLEMPDFVVRLAGVSELLREETIPLPLLYAIVGQYSDAVKERGKEARLHVALSGEVGSVGEGEALITAFWQDYEVSLSTHLTPPGKNRQKYREYWVRLSRFLQTNGDLVELGLAPSWVDRSPFVSEPNVPACPQEGRRLLRGTLRAESQKERRVWTNLAPFLSSRPELVANARRVATTDELELLVDLLERHNANRWQTIGLAGLIAAHPHTTSPLLERLMRLFIAQDGFTLTVFPYAVVQLIAVHPNTSTEPLAQLAQHSLAEVRRLARCHKNAPLNALSLSRQAVLERWRDNKNVVEPFERFISGLHGGLAMETLFYCGTSGMAARRLTAAFALPVEAVKFLNITSSEAMEAGCTTRDLLEHLARDGNRLVRWAAQTRLQDPDYVFRWAELE